MEDTLINFETAKLARKKGFNEKTYSHWEKGIDGADWALFCSPGFISDEFSSLSLLCNSDLTEPYMHNNELVGEFSAPTQSLLQKWLREEHKIYILVSPYLDHTVINHSWYFNIIEHLKIYEILEYHDIFHSYEEALEKGLQEALKLINN